MLTKLVNMLKTMAAVFILSRRLFLALVTLPIPPRYAMSVKVHT